MSRCAYYVFGASVFVCVILCVGEENRRDMGYPYGLMSECPGSEKPAEIPRSQLKYLFFTVQGKRRSRMKYTYWNAKNIVKDPRFDLKKKTVIFACGYLDSSDFPISGMFANLYEDSGYNVILLDNQRFSTVHYYLASRLMRPVGKHVAEVLVQLTQAGLDPSRTELLGFSLGGQTVSFIAKNYQQMAGRNISKITSLEPSGPCYRNLPPEYRLSPSDADFVVVVHTNIDGFGMATPMGHIDFYVNGGEYQPADISIYVCTLTCSHFRVLSIWQSAIMHARKFVAVKCDSVQQARDSQCYDRVPAETNVMGLNVDRSKPGIYYVATSKGYPFYLGAKGLKKEFMAWRTMTDVNDGNQTEIYT